MEDYLVKALAHDGQFRVYTARTTNLVAEAQRRHDTWPTASAALGRALTASAMMATMFQDDGRITVKIDGGGPIGAIIVDASQNGDVRGYVQNPHVDFELNEKGKLDVKRAVGTNGMLTVVKDIGLREKFSGQVPLISGELGEDFTYYFAVSEQIPSSVGVGVLVDTDDSVRAAGGFIVQVMPGTDENAIKMLETRLGKIRPVSALIDEGYSPEDLLYELFEKERVKILEKRPVRFHCDCSKEKFGNALIGLGKAEIRSMIDEDGQAEAQCHFCNSKYFFSKGDLERLYKQADDRDSKTD